MNAELGARSSERKRRRSPRSAPPADRGAFTLLEVVLALTILVGSLAVLGELADQGLTNARQAAALAEAQIHCESKLAEITAGITPPAAVGPAPLDVDPDWLYTIAVEPAADAGLVVVRVTVSENLPPEKRPAEFTLVRWLPETTTVESTTGATTESGR